MHKNHESYCIRHNILNQEAFNLKQVSKTIRNIFKWLKCQTFLESCIWALRNSIEHLAIIHMIQIQLSPSVINNLAVELQW